MKFKLKKFFAYDFVVARKLENTKFFWDSLAITESGYRCSAKATKSYLAVKKNPHKRCKGNVY